MAISIEKSSMWKDISAVLNSNYNYTHIVYQGVIHTELEDYPVLAITTIDIVRDYLKNIGDHINIIFILSMGDYAVRFYPFKNNLEMTLTLSYSPNNNNPTRIPPKPFKQRYKLVFLPDNNLHLDTSDASMMDKQTLDLLEPVTVRAQLLDRALEPLRIKMTSGIYPNIKQETLLRSVLGQQSNLILVDGKPCLDAIDIFPPDNTDLQYHIVIPSNTRVVDIPQYLQEDMNGVYSSGLGSYLQTYNNKKTWFIYPLYNTNRFNDTRTSDIKATFYFLPKFRYRGIDNTYTVNGNNITILCSSDKSYQDDGETQYMNKGVGFQQADARAFMGKPVVMSETGPKGNPAQLSTLVANASRDDGLNYAPNSREGISSNPFKQYSDISKRNVSRIDMVWEYSDPSLIYPGMPCQFVYLENNTLTTIYGVIMYSHTVVAKATNSLQNTLFTRHTFITILASRKPKITTADSSMPVSINR